MSRLMRRPRLLLVAVFLLGALLAGSGVVVAATVIKSGKAVTATKVVTDEAYWHLYTPNTWTDVPGMSLSISVPSSQKALLLINFGGQARCNDGGTTDVWAYCTIRVLVDGTEALPGHLIFDSADGGVNTDLWEAHSMQFVAGPLSAGPHTVKVQALLDDDSSGSHFSLADRTLTVLRSRV